MQKQDYQKLHRELWQWLADNPEIGKTDWPEWDFNGGDIAEKDNYCFPCHYFDNCELCEPNKIAHGDKNIEYHYKGFKSYDECLNGLFQKWDSSIYLVERSDLAMQIKDLW